MAEQPIIIKRKIVKGHGHHGGSWKVAYADFVTAMMAFFMVMWLMNMTQSDKDLVQGYFNDPLGFASTAPKSRTILTMLGMPKPKPNTTAAKGTGDDSQDSQKSEQKALQNVKKEVEAELSSDPKVGQLSKNVKMTITDEGLLIEFIEAKGAVFFESGSSKIRPEARRLVAGIAPILTQSLHPIQVQGHTDAQPFRGRVNGNWALSTERALSLVEALESDRVPDRQFCGLDGFASTRLLDPDHPTSFSNRRVTILLPRIYKDEKMAMPPADMLRSQIHKGDEPEAVIVQPGPPNLRSQKGS